jgi:hypothetical protein
MGTAANKAKSKWNALRYKQVKVSVDPEIADAFKYACETAGVSMAGELSRFMSEFSAVAKRRKLAATADDFTTRRKRRKAVAEMISRMEQVRDAEMHSHDNVPENLRGSCDYEEAEERILIMDEAIELLESIY